MFTKHEEGSTGQLLNLCFWYFFFYVLTGIFVKFFVPKVGDMEWLVWSTLGSNILCLTVVAIGGWYRLKSSNYTTIFGYKVPKELFYIIPSGICTAVVIPTTTLMYSLPITVMVAMVIMRGFVIIFGRIVDFLQIKQGILHKKVYWQEDVGVVVAMLAVSAQIFFERKGGGLDFLTYGPAMVILISYLIAYFFRIYIMNYYKNTRPKDAIYDNKGFFGIEQISSSITMVLVCWLLFNFVNPIKPAGDAIIWQEASAHIGQNISISGKVLNTEEIDGVTHLYFGDASTNNFSVIVQKENYKTFPQSPEKLFKGRVIKVTGTVSGDSTGSQMEITGKKDYKILDLRQLVDFKKAFTDKHSSWPWQMFFGSFFGAVAPFAVFIFMFKGRTATFANLANRLTSLIAGTTSTLLIWFTCSGKIPAITQWISNISGLDYEMLITKIGKAPKPADWVALGLILVAVYFLSLAEKRRVKELKQQHELK